MPSEQPAALQLIRLDTALYAASDITARTARAFHQAGIKRPGQD